MESKKLTFTELWATGVGMCVGSGIMVLIGAGLAITGRSAWLCFALAIVYGFCMNLPYFFLSRTMVIEGGQYAIAYEFTGKPTAGMFMLLQFVTALGTSLMGVAIGTYVQSVFPSINATYVALGMLTFFYVINMIGVKSMAIVQKIMTYVLLAAIVMLIVMGLSKGLDPKIFQPSDPEFMTGGALGFIRCVCMMSFSCWGYYCLMNYSKDAHDPKRNIPKAMLCTIPTIFVLYVGTALVNCGVIPLSEGAGQVLTVAAKAVMPMSMVYIFILCGAVLALTTTLNACMSNNAVVIANGVAAGWLPEKLAATNKFGAPKWILTILFVISVVPVIFKMSITAFVSNLTLITALLQILCAIGTVKAYKRYAAKFPFSKGVFYAGMALSFITLVGLVVYGVLTLNTTAIIINVAYIAFSVVFAILRFKSGKVKNAKIKYYFDSPDEATAQ